MDLTIMHAYDDAPFEKSNADFTSVIHRKYSMIIAVLKIQNNNYSKIFYYQQ